VAAVRDAPLAQVERVLVCLTLVAAGQERARRRARRAGFQTNTHAARARADAFRRSAWPRGALDLRASGRQMPGVGGALLLTLTVVLDEVEASETVEEL
jgi:hypothetical protein